MIDALDALEALEARKPSCYLQSAYPGLSGPILIRSNLAVAAGPAGPSFATMGSSSGSMASAPMRADTRTLHFDDANQKKAAQLCQDYAKTTPNYANLKDFKLYLECWNWNHWNLSLSGEAY